MISDMFSRIAKRYDLANDLLSLGTHRLWKRKALEILQLNPHGKFLDLCCGTGDFLLRTGQGIGADLSFEMLVKARQRNLQSPLLCADAGTLPFKNETFDNVVIGFGIRNIPDPLSALCEIYRVLKKGGRLVVLEFSRPRGKIFSKIYFFYLTKILPWVGGLVSGNAEAYHYLARTIQSFPSGSDFLDLMKKAAFINTGSNEVSLGIASIYKGEK